MNRTGLLRDGAAIVGIGATEFSTRSGRSEARLALEAIRACAADAGLRASEIDGLIRFGVNQTGCSEGWLAANLGIKNLRFWDSIDFGGSGGCALVSHAAAAVVTGLADFVICYRSVNGRSGLRPGTSDTYNLMRGNDPGFESFIAPQGLTAPTELFALVARRYMHEYGMRQEELGAIAVHSRSNANRNPRAQMHDVPLTLDDYFDSSMISSPLHKFDCCLQTDGAVALLVTTRERAADLRQPPVYVRAACQSTAPDMQGPLMSAIVSDCLGRNSAVVCAEDLYAQAGLEPKDIDVAELYDCFTIAVVLQLENYGFCKPGEAGGFISDGGLRGGKGRPAINTSGGHLSEGYFQGVNLIQEGVSQLRGTANVQIEHAQTCLVTAGAPMPASALILSNQAG